ncbi:MAG TPA: Grx4 family monothiol glutaredoxin [Myxococcota bacterium]|jgi:monothiol glutaredoxin|nr:Grx4 family monothiol glutaredoxin [Myxococcota bacterium]
MSLDESTRDRLESLVREHRVLLFMKGNREMPQCGFSARVVGMLDELLGDYRTVDVLSDPAIREGIKVFSNWPTIPQLYVAGEFLGGCDIVTEMYESGELHEKLGVPNVEVAAPRVTVTEAAAAALRQALAEQPNKMLHLSIDARFQNQLFLAPAKSSEVSVESNGITLFLDRATCRRADGLVLDAVHTNEGPAFRIDNPNAPNAVKSLTAQELKAKLDAGEPLRLIDVRTPDERATASIPGAELLTPELAKQLEALPKDHVLVFHCHHGGRSQKAAEHFAAAGFRNVYNVTGGIDAWSREVDSRVPRY